MVKISEKRTIQIPPTKIDNKLLSNIGQILKDECPKDHEVSIQINADSRDIETEDVKEIANMDIPSDTYSIEMLMELPPILAAMTSFAGEKDIEKSIEVVMDLKSPEKKSKIRVKGKNATWVQGVAERIVKVIEKNRLVHRHIARYEQIRFAMSMGTSALLSLALGFAVWFFSKELSMAFLVSFLFFYVLAYSLKRFFDWLFPYFDIENPDFKPRKVRKWAVGILWSSGILTNLIFWILSLPR